MAVWPGCGVEGSRLRHPAQEQLQPEVDRGEFTRVTGPNTFRMRRLSTDRTWSASAYEDFASPLPPGVSWG